jgi:DNA-binding PadR family transcriptional regulator
VRRRQVAETRAGGASRARGSKLTPGNLITHLRKLEDAGYLTSETTGNGRASRTSIALTRQGRAALEAYTAALRDLLGGF